MTAAMYAPNEHVPAGMYMLVDPNGNLLPARVPVTVACPAAPPGYRFILDTHSGLPGPD